MEAAPGTRSKDLLMKMAVGYWSSQVLFVANRLQIFGRLAEGPATAEELATWCQAAPEPLARLLTACVPAGLMEKRGARYRNSPLAERFLVATSPEYMGNWINFIADAYPVWGRLHEAMFSNRPVASAEEHLGEDLQATQNFVLAMHEFAITAGRELVDHLDLAGRRQLVDVGGAAGTYSILFAQKYPALRAIVFDLPPVVAIAREVIASFQLTDRVTTRAGDYHRDDFGGGHDVVFISNVLHQEEPTTCLVILRKAWDALPPGGLLAVHGMFLNAERTGPTWPTLYSLLLLLRYPGGRAYSVDETLALIEEVGFVAPAIKRMSLFNPGSIITATKP